ncbi:hypothetical protein B5M42_016950 [Paenibacillus athensensis]|uniref:Uncharacterized protein n=1 Tax=Paenibacillus athensensis TaxID=1967502 RepID=A0A4Y8PRJ5_9BACL|nr:hypothetical protein [Paenibacillus athensensis]MCD1260491.1 hypothetical protein [Paenibacillus athensensis]
MKTRQPYIPRIRRFQGTVKEVKTTFRAEGQSAHDASLFASGIMGKYGFWRHPYLGVLSLIFRKLGVDDQEGMAMLEHPRSREVIVRLQTQLQSLQHADNAHLSTSRETRYRLEQWIKHYGHVLPQAAMAPAGPTASATNVAIGRPVTNPQQGDRAAVATPMELTKRKPATSAEAEKQASEQATLKSEISELRRKISEDIQRIRQAQQEGLIGEPNRQAATGADQLQTFGEAGASSHEAAARTQQVEPGLEAQASVQRQAAGEPDSQNASASRTADPSDRHNEDAAQREDEAFYTNEGYEPSNDSSISSATELSDTTNTTVSSRPEQDEGVVQAGPATGRVTDAQIQPASDQPSWKTAPAVRATGTIVWPGSPESSAAAQTGSVEPTLGFPWMRAVERIFRKQHTDESTAWETPDFGKSWIYSKIENYAGLPIVQRASAQLAAALAMPAGAASSSAGSREAIRFDHSPFSSTSFFTPIYRKASGDSLEESQAATARGFLKAAGDRAEAERVQAVAELGRARAEAAASRRTMREGSAAGEMAAASAAASPAFRNSNDVGGVSLEQGTAALHGAIVRRYAVGRSGQASVADYVTELQQSGRAASAGLRRPDAGWTASGLLFRKERSVERAPGEQGAAGLLEQAQAYLHNRLIRRQMLAEHAQPAWSPELPEPAQAGSRSFAAKLGEGPFAGAVDPVTLLIMRRAARAAAAEESGAAARVGRADAGSLIYRQALETGEADAAQPPNGAIRSQEVAPSVLDTARRQDVAPGFPIAASEGGPDRKPGIAGLVQQATQLSGDSSRQLHRSLSDIRVSQLTNREIRKIAEASLQLRRQDAAARERADAVTRNNVSAVSSVLSPVSRPEPITPAAAGASTSAGVSAVSPTPAATAGSATNASAAGHAVAPGPATNIASPEPKGGVSAADRASSVVPPEAPSPTGGIGETGAVSPQPASPDAMSPPPVRADQLQAGQASSRGSASANEPPATGGASGTGAEPSGVSGPAATGPSPGSLSPSPVQRGSVSAEGDEALAETERSALTGGTEDSGLVRRSLQAETSAAPQSANASFVESPQTFENEGRDEDGVAVGRSEDVRPSQMSSPASEQAPLLESEQTGLDADGNDAAGVGSDRLPTVGGLTGADLPQADQAAAWLADEESGQTPEAVDGFPRSAAVRAYWRSAAFAAVPLIARRAPRFSELPDDAAPVRRTAADPATSAGAASAPAGPAGISPASSSTAATPDGVAGAAAGRSTGAAGASGAETANPLVNGALPNASAVQGAPAAQPGNGNGASGNAAVEHRAASTDPVVTESSAADGRGGATIESDKMSASGSIGTPPSGASPQADSGGAAAIPGQAGAADRPEISSFAAETVGGAGLLSAETVRQASPESTVGGLAGGPEAGIGETGPAGAAAGGSTNAGVAAASGAAAAVLTSGAGAALTDAIQRRASALQGADLPDGLSIDPETGEVFASFAGSKQGLRGVQRSVWPQAMQLARQLARRWGHTREMRRVAPAAMEFARSQRELAAEQAPGATTAAAMTAPRSGATSGNSGTPPASSAARTADGAASVVGNSGAAGVAASAVGGTTAGVSGAATAGAGTAAGTAAITAGAVLAGTTAANEARGGLAIAGATPALLRVVRPSPMRLAQLAAQPQGVREANAPIFVSPTLLYRRERQAAAEPGGMQAGAGKAPLNRSWLMTDDPAPMGASAERLQRSAERRNEAAAQRSVNVQRAAADTTATVVSAGATEQPAAADRLSVAQADLASLERARSKDWLTDVPDDEISDSGSMYRSFNISKLAGLTAEAAAAAVTIMRNSLLTAASQRGMPAAMAAAAHVLLHSAGLSAGIGMPGFTGSAAAAAVEPQSWWRQVDLSYAQASTDEAWSGWMQESELGKALRAALAKRNESAQPQSPATSGGAGGSTDVRNSAGAAAGSMLEASGAFAPASGGGAAARGAAGAFAAEKRLGETSALSGTGGHVAQVLARQRRLPSRVYLDGLDIAEALAARINERAGTATDVRSGTASGTTGQEAVSSSLSGWSRDPVTRIWRRTLPETAAASVPNRGAIGSPVTAAAATEATGTTALSSVAPVAAEAGQPLEPASAEAAEPAAFTDVVMGRPVGSTPFEAGVPLVQRAWTPSAFGQPAYGTTGAGSSSAPATTAAAAGSLGTAPAPLRLTQRTGVAAEAAALAERAAQRSRPMTALRGPQQRSAPQRPGPGAAPGRAGGLRPQLTQRAEGALAISEAATARWAAASSMTRPAPAGAAPTGAASGGAAELTVARSGGDRNGFGPLPGAGGPVLGAPQAGAPALALQRRAVVDSDGYAPAAPGVYAAERSMRGAASAGAGWPQAPALGRHAGAGMTLLSAGAQGLPAPMAEPPRQMAAASLELLQATQLQHKQPAVYDDDDDHDVDTGLMQPLEMNWLRQVSADEPATIQTTPAEAPPPQVNMEQLRELVTQLPQFDVNKIADRVYREIEKKLKFERQRRGM